jgi:LacI family transcriptional regulator
VTPKAEPGREETPETSRNQSARRARPEGARPTIGDVAERAGVAVATVTRVLSGRGYASAAARAKVLTAADEIGYVPNVIARNLRLQKSTAIGLLIADVENGFYSSIAKHVEAVATAAGHSIVLCNSNDDATREREYLDLLEGIRVAGVILTPTGGNRRRLEEMQRSGITIVQVDREVHHLAADLVLVDNERGAYDAVSALLDAGHTRIGLLAGRPQVITGSGRSEGYLRAHRDHGVAVDPELVRGSSFRRDHAVEEARALLALDPPVTAIFAANNVLAEGCMLALKEAGLRVPADISLAAFDDVEWMRMLDHGITAVRQPVADIARTAAKMMLRRLEGEESGSPATVMYRAELVRRDSIGAPAAARPQPKPASPTAQRPARPRPPTEERATPVLDGAPRRSERPKRPAPAA